MSVKPLQATARRRAASLPVLLLYPIQAYIPLHKKKTTTTTTTTNRRKDLFLRHFLFGRDSPVSKSTSHFEVLFIWPIKIYFSPTPARGNIFLKLRNTQHAQFLIEDR